MSVEELQAAVSRLSAEEFGRFSRWFEEFQADLWDRQIEADICAGRLDEAGNRADEEFEPLSEGLKRELERRIADADANPDAVIPWEVVKAQALARLNR